MMKSQLQQLQKRNSKVIKKQMMLNKFQKRTILKKNKIV